MREFDVDDRRATWLELFFDLCFVAAIAALADGLHHDPTMQGLWHFALLFVPVWWAWMEFTWFATAWDNDDLFHRLAMLRRDAAGDRAGRRHRRPCSKARATRCSCGPTRACSCC